jgi:outer membrane immunogenic protein
MRTFLTISTILLLQTAATGADTASASPASALPANLADTVDWTGVYAGIHVGYGRMDGYFETAGFAPLDSNLDGRLFGAFIGFNRQFDNNLVFGIEGDLERNSNDVALQSAFGTISGGADWQGSVRTRIGYAWGPILAYATAGWAATHIEADLIGITTATETFGGYTAGAGVDYAVTDCVFGRIDYRYNDFGNGKLDFGAAVVDSDLTQQTVRVGLGIKF